MADKCESRIVVSREVRLSNLVQNISQKLIAYGEGLKGSKIWREELTVQARILDASCLLGASRPVRIGGRNMDEGRSNLHKSQETSGNLRKSYENSERHINYRRVKMNSRGSYL